MPYRMIFNVRHQCLHAALSGCLCRLRKMT
jgi:hypothetical protein